MKGGCTTYLACALTKKLIEENFDIIGFPRLVRLNPNVPWKTRGNGAISIQVGKGEGKKIKIGEINNIDIYCFEKNRFENNNEDKFQKILEIIIDKYAKLEDKNTNSGFVIFKKQPSLTNYKRTVKEIVSLKDTKNLLKTYNAYYKGYKNSRGLIGATAAVAWSSNNDKTYELITYRKKEKWGKKRNVDNNSTIKMDKLISSTFDNYDYKNKHNKLVPNSPCPVLYGIRGDNQIDLIKAKSFIKSEEVESWLIFETNQGTDDHLQKKSIGKINPYESVITEGIVGNLPTTIEGGHVLFSIRNTTNKIDCAAYEPTKEFRNIIRELIIGDEVEVYGGVREKPLTINLEKIKIKHLNKKIEKIENPVCPKCGKHMKSIGKNQGFKCKKCGLKSDKIVTIEKKRKLKLGIYETPVCARRHLSKPLKRYNHKPF